MDISILRGCRIEFEKLPTLRFWQSTDRLVHIPEKWLFEGEHIHEAHLPAYDTPLTQGEDMMKVLEGEEWKHMNTWIISAQSQILRSAENHYLMILRNIMERECIPEGVRIDKECDPLFRWIEMVEGCEFVLRNISEGTAKYTPSSR